jgi:protein gp37
VNPIRYKTLDGRVVWACEKISPGCTNCYAEGLSHRWPKRRAGAWNSWTMARLTTFLDNTDLRRILTHEPASGKRCFLGDMTDVFGDWVPDHLLDYLFAALALRSDVTWQLLTKRPHRLLAYMTEPEREARWMNCAAELIQVFDLDEANIRILQRREPWLPLPNVWLGVSCEDQQRADERIPLLLQTPAAVRFVSAEPLLGPIDFRRHLQTGRTVHVSCDVEGMIEQRAFRYLTEDDGTKIAPVEAELRLRELAARGVKRIKINGSACEGFSSQTGCPGHRHASLHWLIAGGESGPDARPCDAGWIFAITQQCRFAKVPVFVKQLGARPFDYINPGPATDWPGDLRVFRNSQPLIDAVTLHQRRNVNTIANRTIADVKGGDVTEWPDYLRAEDVRMFPEARV